jgi:hypothetical protein
MLVCPIPVAVLAPHNAVLELAAVLQQPRKRVAFDVSCTPRVGRRERDAGLMRALLVPSLPGASPAAETVSVEAK